MQMEFNMGSLQVNLIILSGFKLTDRDIYINTKVNNFLLCIFLIL